MARQIAIRDDIYQALNQIKGSKSFSQVLEELLRSSGKAPDPMLQVLQSQTDLLNQILAELRALNRRLSSLKLEVKEARSIRLGSENVTGVTNKKLPSYLRDNPWIGILQKRVEEG